MTRSIECERADLLLPLFGAEDAVLRRCEELADVQIVARGSTIFITGEEASVIWVHSTLLSFYRRLLASGQPIETADVEVAYRLFYQAPPEEDFVTTLSIPGQKKKAFRTKTPQQSAYLDSIFSHDIVFSIGPAGTGKTYLAVAAGVSLLMKGSVNRLILSRPAVTAGENLGFLPGDFKEKVDPYLRPLYDALYDLLPESVIQQKIQNGQIEIAPLAYMRGRTLSNSFVILDEAQNVTPLQMKMFLTRLGRGSQMVITGDVSQIDLPKGTRSGLQEAQEILQSLPAISFFYFTASDVCRHPLVGQIIRAYEHKS